jgi:hypothetical protein
LTSDKQSLEMVEKEYTFGNQQKMAASESENQIRHRPNISTTSKPPIQSSTSQKNFNKFSNATVNQTG